MPQRPSDPVWLPGESLKKIERRELFIPWEDARQLTRAQQIQTVHNYGLRDYCDCWDNIHDIQKHQRTRNGMGTPVECTICGGMMYPLAHMYACDECYNPCLANKSIVTVEDEILCDDCKE